MKTCTICNQEYLFSVEVRFDRDETGNQIRICSHDHHKPTYQNSPDFKEIGRISEALRKEEQRISHNANRTSS